MKSLLIFVFFIMFLISVQFTAAQTVGDIIDKHIKALGGLEKLQTLNTIYMEGVREMMGNEVVVKVFREKNKLFRTEYEMQGKTGFNLITDKEAWNYFPMRMDAPKKMPDDAVSKMQLQLDLLNPLIDYGAKGYTLELIGKETVDNIECYKIKTTDKNQQESFYWIDVSTNLIYQAPMIGSGLMGRRRENNGETAPTPSDARKTGKPYQVFKDYKNIDGIMIAHTIEIKMENGEMRGGGTTFDKVEINKPIDAKYYKPE